MPAARLDAPQGRKQLLCCDRRDRPAAKVRVKSALQPRAQNGYGLGGERLALQLEPFLRHALEGLEKRRALRLALCAWIDVIRDESARLVALLACALQRHVRISAQRDELFASSHAIAETPQSAAGGRHQQVQATLIEEFVGALTRFRASNSCVAQTRHLTLAYPSEV